jgi:hypothetical protein
MQFENATQLGAGITANGKRLRMNVSGYEQGSILKKVDQAMEQSFAVNFLMRGTPYYLIK